MSNELLLAESKGNLSQVKKLLKDPAININTHFYLKLDASTDTDKTALAKKLHYDTPLTKAIKHKHTEIAAFLLNQSNIEIEADSNRYYVGGYKTALAISCAYKSDFSLYKILLHKTNNLSSGAGEFTLPELIGAIPSVNEKAARLGLLLQEAISRNDKKLIDHINIAAKQQMISLTEYPAQHADKENKPDKPSPVKVFFSKLTHNCLFKSAKKTGPSSDSKPDQDKKMPITSFLISS